MPDLTTRLTKKALVLAKQEVTFGVDPTPDATNDAFEVSEPDFQIDPQILERNNVADDLSPFAHVIGRKQATMTFTGEMKGNGVQHSGAVADAPMIARLMKACGYALTAMDDSASQITDPVSDASNDLTGPTVAWGTKAGTITSTTPLKYTIEVTVAGPSLTAEVFVTSNDLDDDDTSDDVAQVVTSGSPINIGSLGATIVPTWTGNLILGDKWHVVVYPTGVVCRPISTGQPTMYFYMYLDGVLHKMAGSRGNFTITSEAGDFARVEFTFQGVFVDPVDAVAPASPVYEDTLPEQIELSNLTWGTQRDLVAQQWSYEQANTLTPRPDVNSPEGVKGVRITARTPAINFNPEATIEADHPFWNEIKTGRTQYFFAKIGQTQGQTITIMSPRGQMSALPYGDRDGIRTYDIAARCTRNQGDDEVEFAFV